MCSALMLKIGTGVGLVMTHVLSLKGTGKKDIAEYIPAHILFQWQVSTMTLGHRADKIETWVLSVPLASQFTFCSSTELCTMRLFSSLNGVHSGWIVGFDELN